MARLWTCGFEENNITTSIWNATSGSLSTSSPHSGTYKLLIGTGNTAIRKDLAALKSSGTVYTRFYFSASSAAPSTDRTIHKVASGGSVVGYKIILRTTGVLQIQNVILSETVDTTSTLTANHWYRIEVRHLISDTVGEIELRLYDGDSVTPIETLQYGSANKDTLPSSIQQYHFGQEGSGSISMSYDDIAINDTTGTFQTSWPGPAHTYLISPNSNVTNEFEDETSGSSTYTNINEIPGTVDNANYNVENAVLNSTDRFGLADLGAELGSNPTIKLLDVYGIVGSDQTSTATLNWILWDEGGNNVAQGPSVNCNTAAGSYKLPLTSEHLVYDASAKSLANINDFNVGYTNVTDTVSRARRVSAVWVQVEWLPSTSSTMAADGGTVDLTGADATLTQGQTILTYLRVTR